MQTTISSIHNQILPASDLYLIVIPTFVWMTVFSGKYEDRVQAGIQLVVDHRHSGLEDAVISGEYRQHSARLNVPMLLLQFRPDLLS